MNWEEYDDRGRVFSCDNVLCDQETDAAIHVVFDDKTDAWFPKSQVSDESEVYEKDDEGTLIVTKWILEQKDLL